MTFKNLTKFADNFAKIPDEMTKAVFRASHLAGKHFEAKSRNLVPVKSGRAKNSIGTITGISGSVIKTIVESNLNYFPVIEEGRKVGTFPNLGGITEFLARTNDLQTKLKGDRKIRKIKVSDRFDNLDTKQKSLVFIVAISIMKKGIKGKFIFKQLSSNPQILNNINKIMRLEISKFIKSL